MVKLYSLAVLDAANNCFCVLCVLRMASCLQVIQILSTESITKSHRSPLMARDCRYDSWISYLEL